MKAIVFSIVMWVMLTLAAHSPVLAHAIRYTTGSGGLVVTAMFDGGQPASDMFVSVFAPGLEERFQSGRTDKNGRFVILPDRSGTWEILVYDRMGHRLEIKLPIDGALGLVNGREADGLYRHCKILMGIAVIAILFSGLGALKYFRKNRRQ